jgi:hypothetical protein
MDPTGKKSAPEIHNTHLGSATLLRRKTIYDATGGTGKRSKEGERQGREGNPALVWLESMRLTRHWNLLTAGAASSSCALYKGS